MADKKQLNLYLEEDLIKGIRHAAVEADRRLSDYVAEILTAHLDVKRRVSNRIAEILDATRTDQ